MESKRSRGWFLSAIAVVVLAAATILAFQFNDPAERGDAPAAAMRPQNGGAADETVDQPVTEPVAAGAASAEHVAVDAIRAVEAPAADLNLPKLFDQKPGSGRHGVFEIQSVSPDLLPDQSLAEQPSTPATLDINLSDDRGY